MGMGGVGRRKKLKQQLIKNLVQKRNLQLTQLKNLVKMQRYENHSQIIDMKPPKHSQLKSYTGNKITRCEK